MIRLNRPGVYRFELCGVDAPLICANLQPFEDGWQCVVDVTTLVATDDSTRPVDLRQIVPEIELYSALLLGGQPILKRQ